MSTSKAGLSRLLEKPGGSDTPSFNRSEALPWRAHEDPGDDDLIVPTRNMTERPSPDAQHALLLDLDLLALRPRRGHDLRRTFIALAQVDGARRDLLESITHGPRGDIINVYTTFPWPALCTEVQKLKVSFREGQVLEGDFRGLATSLATTQRNWRNRRKKSATPAGFEPFRHASTTSVARRGLASIVGAFGEVRTRPVVPPRTVQQALNPLCRGNHVATKFAEQRAPIVC